MSISPQPLDRSSQNFVCRSHVAVARSSSGSIVLPVLWMTSRLAVMSRMELRGQPDQLCVQPGWSLLSMNAVSICKATLRVAAAKSRKFV